VSEESSNPNGLVEAALAAQTPSPTPETPTDPPANTETPETVETPETPEGETEESSSDAASIIEYIRDELGEDLSGQFNDDKKLLESLLNARKLVGQRDEDATYGKQLRAILGGNEGALQEFLAGKQQAAAPPAQQQPSNQPVSYEQYQLMATQVASGKASAAVKDRWEKLQEDFGRKAFEMVFQNPMQAAFEDRIKALESQFDQRLSQREFQDEITAWDKQHAALLYVDGDPTKGYTPLGSRFEAIYSTDTSAVPAGVARATLALKLAQAEQPKANPVRKPPQKAKHQPAIATPPSKAQTQADLLGQIPDFAKLAFHGVKTD
jgi:hypothetical protein